MISIFCRLRTLVPVSPIFSIVLLLLAIGSYLIITHRSTPAPYQRNEGAVFGTFYHITYQCPDDLQADIAAELARVDQSLSMFNPQSTLSRLNQGEDIVAGLINTLPISEAQRLKYYAKSPCSLESAFPQIYQRLHDDAYPVPLKAPYYLITADNM